MFYCSVSMLVPISLLAFQLFMPPPSSNNYPWLRLYLLEFCYHVGSITVPVVITAASFLCRNGPPHTIRGIRFMHGSLYTGPYIRHWLLQTPRWSLRILTKFLLRLETYPYFLYLSLGYVITLFLIVHHAYFPSQGCSQGLLMRIFVGLPEALMPFFFFTW